MNSTFGYNSRRLQEVAARAKPASAATKHSGRIGVSSARFVSAPAPVANPKLPNTQVIADTRTATASSAFNKLKQARRIVTRYDATALSFASFLNSHEPACG